MVNVVQSPSVPKPNFGLSQSTTTFSIIKSTVVMNFHIFTRYKANFIGGFFEIGIMTAAMFLFSTVVNFRNVNLFKTDPGENAMFIFFLAGMLMMFFQNTALFVPVNSVRRDLYNGALEYIYSGPQSRYAYLVGNIIADLLIRQIFMIPMLIGLIALVGISYHIFFMIMVILVFFSVVTSVGIMVSLMAITWKQVGNLVQIFALLLQFVGGVFLPVQSFPVAIQWVAFLLPFTFAYDLLRYYTFQGNWNPLIPLHFEWLALIAYALFFYFISQYLIRKVERYAKKSGLHIL